MRLHRLSLKSQKKTHSQESVFFCDFFKLLYNYGIMETTYVPKPPREDNVSTVVIILLALFGLGLFGVLVGGIVFVKFIDTVSSQKPNPAEILSDLGVTDQTANLIESRFDNTPDDTDFYILKSMALARSGDMTKATQFVIRAMEREKTKPPRLYEPGFSQYLFVLYMNADPETGYPNKEILKNISELKKTEFYQHSTLAEEKDYILDIEITNKITGKDGGLSGEGCAEFEENIKIFNQAERDFLHQACVRKATEVSVE